MALLARNRRRVDRGNGAVRAGALAVTLDMLAFAPDAQGQTSGAIPLDLVQSSVLNADGSLQVILNSGRALTIPAQFVVVGEGGAIQLLGGGLELITQAAALAAPGAGLAGAAGGAAGAGVGAGAGLAAAGAGLAAASQQGGSGNAPSGGASSQSLAQITGPTSATLTEDTPTPARATLTITDPDQGQSAASPQTDTNGTYGRLGITSAGVWTYTLDNTRPATQALTAGQEVTDSFTVTSADGSASQQVVMTVTGAQDLAQITGTTSGNVTEDASTSAVSGTLTVTDADQGQSAASPQTETNGTYGRFSITSAGVWTYTLDNSRTATQALTAGQNVTDSFTVTSADGSASQQVVMTVTGAQDVAQITGTTSGNVTEDASTSAVTGTLTVTDADQGQSAASPQTETNGTYGRFSITSAGVWTYTLDNSRTATQALTAGQEVTDSFTVTSADGSASRQVVMTVTGAQDVAQITGTASGNVTEDAPTSAITGTLTVTDADQGQSAASPQTETNGTYGRFSITSAGVWTYTLDNTRSATQALAAGQEVTDSFTVTSADGSASQPVVITVTGAQDLAQITGSASGNVTEDTSTTATGTLTVTDADQGQSAASPQTDTNGTYGRFGITSAGVWTYTLDNTRPATQALTAGQEIPDSFTVTSADGSAGRQVVVTVAGAQDVAQITGSAAGDVTEDASNSAISETLTVTDADQGQSGLVAQSDTIGTYGRFSITSAGVWTYTLDNTRTATQALAAGQNITDSFTVTSADGSASQQVVVTVTGAQDVAQITGTAAGDVTEDASTNTITGTLTVTDADQGQSSVIAQTNTNGTYGRFSITSAGGWTYSLDNTRPATQALTAGQEVTDSFTVTSADGSASRQVVITVTGAQDVMQIAPVELADIAQGEGGFVIMGAAAFEQAGYAVASAGDVNGDGYADLVVGAPFAGSDSSEIGASYVIFGGEDLGAVDLAQIVSGQGGFLMTGVALAHQAGFAVAAAGDVNNDGMADLIVGAPGAGPEGNLAGASYVVFGKADTGGVALADIESGTGGFAILGAASGNMAGRAVGGAGDVNGDGLADVIIGAPQAGANDTYIGASYVVFGKADGAAVQLSDLESPETQTSGFAIYGAADADLSGWSVAMAGDVNGDGRADLIVGAKNAGVDGDASGASYVVFGKADGAAVQLSDIAAGTGGGFAILGLAGSLSGSSVASAGDVNGDGRGDLIIGAPFATVDGLATGASYVVFGKDDSAAVNLADILQGEGGFAILGVAEGDQAGSAVASAGDMNGDGRGDLIIGAPWASPNGSQTGASYVVFGKADGDTVALSDVAAGTGGFVIHGLGEFDKAGHAVATAGDVNGDGFADVIVGAPEGDVVAGDVVVGENAGTSFVVFGRNFTADVTHLGTALGEEMIGTAADEVIFAAQGEDTLQGGGGADRLSGGAGADQFVITNTDGTARIIDFDGTQGDQLNLHDFALGSWSAVAALATAEGPGGYDTRLTLDANTAVILEGVRPDDLVAAHVIL